MFLCLCVFRDAPLEDYIESGNNLFARGCFGRVTKYCGLISMQINKGKLTKCGHLEVKTFLLVSLILSLL